MRQEIVPSVISGFLGGFGTYLANCGHTVVGPTLQGISVLAFIITVFFCRGAQKWIGIAIIMGVWAVVSHAFPLFFGVK